MHEAMIVKKLIEEIEVECNKNNIKTLSKVVVDLGEIATYKSDPIMFYFDSYKKEYDFVKDAEIVVNEIDGKIKCNACNKESGILDSTLIFCSECDSGDVDVIQGKEFMIKELIGNKS